MTSCSHHGDQGCVPHAARATPSASASPSRRVAVLDELRAASGNVSQRPVLTSISDEISSPAVCSPSAVASRARLELGEAVDEPVRLGVDDLELLLDREGEILRSARRSRGPRRAPRAGRGCSGPSGRGYQRIRGGSPYSKARNLPIRARVEHSRRAYFLLLTMASVLGWTAGLWAVPIVAFVALEVVWTAAEWTRERTGSATPARAGSQVR